ncbi:hypothetical protein Ancab_010693 [Ancistrocladus abbreviatus]
MKATDLERWMHHRQLPKELRQGVCRCHKYKWVAIEGVDEEAILREFLTNKIQTKQYPHLNLVHKVPLFDQLDDRTLCAICERLRPALYTRGMHLFYEGDRVNDLLLIMRGHLHSYTTAGGQTRFFNSSTLGPHDSCGRSYSHGHLTCIMLASCPHQHVLSRPSLTWKDLPLEQMT